jgi:hypothetical protein
LDKQESKITSKGVLPGFLDLLNLLDQAKRIDVG